MFGLFWFPGRKPATLSSASRVVRIKRREQPHKQHTGYVFCSKIELCSEISSKQIRYITDLTIFINTYKTKEQLTSSTDSAGFSPPGPGDLDSNSGLGPLILQLSIPRCTADKTKNVNTVHKLCPEGVRRRDRAIKV